MVWECVLGGHGRRASWSADGKHVLATAVEHVALRLLVLDETSSCLRQIWHTGCPDAGYHDAVFYPGGGGFVSTSKHSPCILRDFAGCPRASYLLMDQSGERPAPVTALAWTGDGCSLLGAHQNGVAVWDASRPGLPVVKQLRASSGKQDRIGRMACIAHCDSSRRVAAGSHSGHVRIIDSRVDQGDVGGGCVLWKAQANGVSQVTWSSDHALWVGGRRSAELCCFDLRGSSEDPVLKLERPVCSSQPVYFCVTAHQVLSGDTSVPLGLVSVWDVATGEKMADLPLRNDVVCSVDVHPRLPLLLAMSGQRYSENPDNGIGLYKRTAE